LAAHSSVCLLSKLFPSVFTPTVAHGFAFLSLTPALPPFSAMNSTPVASRAARIVATLARCDPDFSFSMHGDLHTPSTP
jgi:hypothetical protein